MSDNDGTRPALTAEERELNSLKLFRSSLEAINLLLGEVQKDMSVFVKNMETIHDTSDSLESKIKNIQKTIPKS